MSTAEIDDTLEEQVPNTEIEEAKELLSEAANVDDDSEKDDTIRPIRYEVSSYGADIDVEGLVRRIETKEILIPLFQRQYVWSEADASRFIESLLLGLPVPGIFLAKEPDTGKLLVVDGQQRLKSLQFFIAGIFNPLPDAKRKRVFKLSHVQEKFDGKTYESLSTKDQLNLKNTVIHATIIKQDYPKDDDTAIYHIFERLNNGGRKLTAQEIRSAISHGSFIAKLASINDNPEWRAIFGKKNKRLKDQELILRFFAFLYRKDKYSKPMTDFLNTFVAENRNPSEDFLRACDAKFSSMISLAYTAIGESAFRAEGPLNVAVFDAVAYGLAKRIEKGKPSDLAAVKQAYERLLENDGFRKDIYAGTSDEKNVERRLSLSEDAFRNVS